MKRSDMKPSILAAVSIAFCLAATAAPPTSLLRPGLSSGSRQPPASASTQRGRPQNAGAAGKASPNAVATASAVGESEGSSDLNFKDAPGDMVFEVYGKLIDRTVLKDPQTPTVTITLQSLPGQKLSKEDQISAIETVMEMNGVHFEPYGEKFVRALPRKDVRKVGIRFIASPSEEPLPEVENVVSMMLDFKNIPVDEAQKALEGFKSNSGLLQVFERTNKILVTDSQMNINRMVEIARAIDIASPVLENVFVRQIKHAAASEIKTALEQIVTESQKEQEKNGKQQNSMSQNATRMGSLSAGPTSLLRRPGMPGAHQQPAAPSSVESLVTSVSDADRGMIRGKVLIIADERSNKLIIVTMKSNMDFFDKVIEQLDVETTPDVQVKVYRLKYAEAEDVADMINDLIGNSVSSKSNSKQTAGSAGGSNANLTRGSQAPSVQRQSANQRGGNGQSKAGELSKENVTVLADKRINGLVVMARTEDIPTIEQIIESMDIKLSQVLIETAIIEVTLDDTLKTGVDWVMRGRQKLQASQGGNKLYWNEYRKTADGHSAGEKTGGYTTDASWQDDNGNIHLLDPVMHLVRDTFVNRGSSGLGGGGGGLGGAGSELGNLMSEATTTAGDVLHFGSQTPIGSGINYLLKSDKLNLAAIIQATKNDNQTKYIASPVVMTVDNKEAIIDATANRQFLVGWTANSGNINGTSGQPTPSYSSKDIGIKLKITPKINPNGTVMLKVEEEYSQFQQDGQSMLIPQSDGNRTSYVPGKVDLAVERKMSADVLLEDRQTVVLGGMTDTMYSESETGIPILKDIPWIGKWLFGSVAKSEQRTELLIFLTPYVLNDAESAQAEAMRRKRTLSDSRPWDDHGWSASELADPVSKKELLRRLKDEAEKQDEERKSRLAVEKWKLDRAKALEKMDESERKFWIEQHREELEKEEKKEFDRQVKEQEDLKELVKSIRDKDMRKAEEKIKTSGEEEKKAGKEAEMGRAEAAAGDGTGKKDVDKKDAQEAEEDRAEAVPGDAAGAKDADKKDGEV